MGKSRRLGKVGFVSDKGYGFVDLEDDTRVFAPGGMLQGLAKGQEVVVDVDEGHLGPTASGLWPKAQDVPAALPNSIACSGIETQRT